MLEAHVVKVRRDFVVEAQLRVGTESVAIFGASGAGKSTLLACIAGVEQPDRGQVSLEGRRLYPPPLALHERGIGYLTQRPLLFPHLNVERNVCFGLSGARREREWLEELRERFNLGAIWRATATAISGGQAQRVALARMFARRPALVLLDEPFAGLDRIVTRELIATLKIWQRAHKFASLIVDHQENVVRQLCERIYVMERGQIIQEGRWVDIDTRPASPTLTKLLAPL